MHFAKYTLQSYSIEPSFPYRYINRNIHHVMDWFSTFEFLASGGRELGDLRQTVQTDTKVTSNVLAK